MQSKANTDKNGDFFDSIGRSRTLRARWIVRSWDRCWWGSLPGIIIGSLCAIRVPEAALRVVLAVTLIVVAGKLLSDELHSSSSMLTVRSSAATR